MSCQCTHVNTPNCLWKLSWNWLDHISHFHQSTLACPQSDYHGVIQQTAISIISSKLSFGVLFCFYNYLQLHQDNHVGYLVHLIQNPEEHLCRTQRYAHKVGSIHFNCFIGERDQRNSTENGFLKLSEERWEISPILTNNLKKHVSLRNLCGQFDIHYTISWHSYNLDT